MASIYVIGIYLVNIEGLVLLSTSEDRKIFHELLRPGRWEGHLSETAGEIAIAVGASFLGTPYAPCTLEQAAGEDLVINLRQLDCFTFVENTVIMARLIKAGRMSFADFASALNDARYRHGLREGYSSRLHYFSDWLHDNQKKGLVKDITRKIGGETFRKKIAFMTANRDKYPALKCRNEYIRMLEAEKTCSRRLLHHIPKARLKACADKIANGDVIAITTALNGLDVLHVGLAIKIKSHLHLLHASERAGRVVISGETLYRYLMRGKSRLGIMAARVL